MVIFMEISNLSYSGPECTIDECEGIECGNGTCIGGICSCVTNYVNIGNVCQKTCALQPCQASNINYIIDFES